MQRVGDQVGGVELARREPAELLGDLVRADARGVEQRLALDERDGGRGRGGERAAARGLEAREGDPVALDAQRDPDRSPQAAPPAAPSCPPVTGTPRPAGALRCSAKRSRSTPPSLGG